MKVVKYRNCIENNKRLNSLFSNGYNSLNLKFLYLIKEKKEIIGAFYLSDNRYRHLIVPENAVKLVLDYVEKKKDNEIICLIGKVESNIWKKYDERCRFLSWESGLTCFAI